MSRRLSQNSRAEDRRVELSHCLRGLEAAERSGLDQRQVAEETTTCWLCLHVQSSRVFGHTVTEIVFNVDYDTLQLFVQSSHLKQSQNVCIKV